MASYWHPEYDCFHAMFSSSGMVIFSHTDSFWQAEVTSKKKYGIHATLIHYLL
ncbi:hypothetical protein [Leuconostoc mesenteroides]|uniref:hypothetical protein n=1 Tax=Leuconostoc mesenteroides TaxID=1245 RepID=UPI001CC0C52B|nr:hypothetical protein [Leuconostoc mesenteroides]